MAGHVAIPRFGTMGSLPPPFPAPPRSFLLIYPHSCGGYASCPTTDTAHDSTAVFHTAFVCLMLPDQLYHGQSNARTNPTCSLDA